MKSAATNSGGAMEPAAALQASGSPESWRSCSGVFCTMVVAVTLVVVGLVIYRDFVFGDRTLLYKDIGSDSINIFFPYYVLLSDYLRETGIPTWSFRVGMGQNIFSLVGTILVSPVVWLSRDAIAKGLVYQHLIYVVISGALFARYLSDRGLSFASCLLGALLLGFSAYMCMGSCWYFHAAELLCFAFLLLAAERAATGGRWFYLPLAVALVGFFSVFHLYLCAVFLCLYVPLRVAIRCSWQPFPTLRVCLLLGATALLGAGLSAIVAIGGFYSLLNSPRGLGSRSLVGALSSFPIFHLESSRHYITAILRFYANDMSGTGSDFHGWQNYLEAPMTYSGLICLLLLPQIFVSASRRQRIIYTLFLLFVFIPTVFPWFRYLFWAFQGNYYRAFSLFSIFGIITLSMTVLSRYIRGQRLNLWILAATVLALVGILYLPLDEMQAVINRELRLWVTILLAGYALVLVAGQLLRRQSAATWLIVVFVVMELIHFDRITVGDRPTVTKQELTERVGYNDETVDAIRDINATDHSFFRFAKTRFSGLAVYWSVNDAMVFGYYGTPSYSSFNDLNYIKFLMALDLIKPEDIEAETRWSLGLLGRPVASTFAAEKYVLTDDPVPFQIAGGYEFVRNYGKAYLYRNRLFLPLGLTFRQYLPEDLFLQLRTDAKEDALLRAVVLSEKNARDGEGLLPLTLSELERQRDEVGPADIVAERRTTALEMRSFSQTRIEATVRLEEKSVLVVQTPFDPGWHVYEDGRPVPTIKVDVALLGAPLDKGEHTVELHYRPPFLAGSAAVSLLSLIGLIVIGWRWPSLSCGREDQHSEFATGDHPSGSRICV